MFIASDPLNVLPSFRSAMSSIVELEDILLLKLDLKLAQ